jgi:hypothetical protein
MGDATERQEGATPNRGDPLEIAGLLREGEPCHHDRCKIRTPDSCLCAEAAEALTRGVEALLSERSARLAAERERDEARVAWRSATETVGAASRVYETALDGRVETKRALRDAELRADAAEAETRVGRELLASSISKQTALLSEAQAADAAGYRRGLEEAAKVALQKRDGYRAATHPRGPMRYRAEGMAVGADFIADAIRALSRQAAPAGNEAVGRTVVAGLDALDEAIAALPRASSASQGER